MNKVTSYLKNMSKSIVYATTDISEKLIPEIKDFNETNEEILKSMYAVAAHPKKTIEISKKTITQSQIYKDINKGIEYAIEDIKTGNFYNKERSERMADEAGANLAFGGDGDFGDDFGDFNFDDDFNFDADDSEDSGSSSITQGDLVVADSVNKSANLSAQLISTTVAKTSKSIVQSSIANTNLLMSQNMQLMAGVRTSIAGVHASVNSILTFATENLKPHMDSQAEYMTKTQELMVENNAILKEMLEMQRNIYKAETEKSKSGDQFSDVFSGNTIDLQEYFKAITKNIKNLDKTGSLDMIMSEMGGQTMLSQMLSNPLGTITAGLIKSFMPASLAKSIASFNKSLGGIFPALIAKMNRWRDKEDGTIFEWIGRIFGLNLDTKESIDVSKYNKGAVPFDGVTRKAIIDVIPEHLSKIESLLTGQSQRVYDYQSGKWTSIAQIKKDKEQMYENNAKNAFSAYDDDQKRFLEQVKKSKVLDANEMKSLEKDFLKMKVESYKKGSWSPENIKKNLWEYINDEKNYEIIKAFLDVITDDDFNGRTSKASETTRSIAEAKRSYADKMRNAEEKGDDTLRKLHDNSEGDSHLKLDKITNLPVGLDRDKVIGLGMGDSLMLRATTEANDILNDIRNSVGIIVNRYKKMDIDIMHERAKYERIPTSELVNISKLYNPIKNNEIKSTTGSNNIENNIIPEAVLKAREDLEKEESRYNSYNYIEGNDLEEALRQSIFVTRRDSEEDLDEDELKDFGTRLKKQSKYKEKYDSIYGKTFGEKLSNAHTMKERYAVIMASLHDLSKRPVEMLNGLIYKADKSIYNMLFGAEKDDLDDDEGKDIKGLMGDMKDKMISTWTLVTQTLTEKVIDPLAKKFGVDEKWNNLKDKINNTSIVQKLKEFGSNVKDSLKTNLLGMKDYTVNSIKEVTEPIRNDPLFKNAQIQVEKGKLNAIENNLKNVIKTKEDLNNVLAEINALPKEEQRKIPFATQIFLARKNKEFADKEAANKKSDNTSVETKATGGVDAGNGTKVTITNEDETVYVANNKPENSAKNDKKETKLLDKINEQLNHKRKHEGKIKELEASKNDTGPIQVMTTAIAQEAENIVDSFMGITGKTPEEKDKSVKKEKSKLTKTVSSIFADMKGEGANTVAKSLIGGGLGLLSGIVGGPLIGAGTSIIQNSETAKKYLFGELEEDGETRKGGVISKKTQDTFKKYIPDMGKYGVAGIASSLIMPYGPLAGAAIGAGVSFIKNSQTMNEMIFGKDIVDENGNVTGKDNSGLLTPARLKKIKEYAPKAALGAIGGMVLGPFGLLGNAALGAGIGMITGTEEFKDLIFGKDDGSGNRIGGLKDALNEHFVDPLREFGTNFKDDFFGFIKQKMIDPLNEAITPLANEIAYQTKRVVFGIPKMFAKMTKDTIATPLMAILTDKIIDPIANMSKKVFGGVFSIGKKVISVPFKAVRGLGNIATKKQIRRGNTVNMSASQRIQFRETHNMGEDDFSALDRDMVEMNQEKIEEYNSALNAMKQGDKYFDKEMKKVTNDLGKLISTYLKEGIITGGTAGKVRKAIKNGDIEGAITILSEAKKTRSGGKLTDEDFKKISAELKQGSEEYEKIKLRRDQFSEKRETVAKHFKDKYGLDVNNDKTLNALINNFGEEKRRAAARTDLEKSMEKPEDLITEGDKGIISELKDIKSYILKMVNGEDVLSNGRQNTLNNYSNRANKAISRNMNTREANNKLFGEKTGFSDNAEIVSLFATNKNLYNLVLSSQGKGIYYSTDNIMNLSKLNKKQLKVVEKMPYLGLLDLNILKKFTSKTRDSNRAGVLNTAIKSGVDINSVEEAMLATDTNTSKKDHRKRSEYYNRLNQLGVIGEKVSKKDVLSKNGLTYAQMDKLIEEQEKLNKLKDDDNLDEAEVATSKPGFKERFKTVFTQFGPVKYFINKRGEYKKVNSRENKETEEEMNKDNEERKGIISSLSSLKDSFLGFFGKKDEKDDKKSWWEKLLDNPVTQAAGKVLTIGGALFGIGKFAEAWTNEGEDGTMHTIANKAKEIISPVATKITDWLSGSGEYEGKGLPGWFSNTVLPGILNGTQFIFEKVVPKLAESIISALPSIISGVIKGIEGILGIGKNNHINDNTGTDKDFDNSSGTLTWNGATVYDQNGDLISEDADTSKLNEFYTNQGVKYTKDSEGNWVSEKGSTTRTNRDTLFKRFGGAFVKASLTGRTGANVISGIGKTISKVPYMKTAGKAVSTIGKGLDTVTNSGVAVNKFAKAVTQNKKSGLSLGKAIIEATKSEGRSMITKVTDFIQNIFTKLFNNGAVKEKVKEGLAEAGKEVTEKAVKESAETAGKEFTEKVVKEASSEAIEKISTKASKYVASGGVALAIDIGFAITDFITGFDQAKAILGIDQVSFAQRFLSGLVNALNNFLFFGIIDTATIVNWLAGPILKIFGQDPEAFKKQQAEADKIVDQYNVENGTNYSKAEYYRNQTFTGKVGNAISDTWQNIKSVPGKAIGWIKDKSSPAIEWGKERVSDIGTGITTAVSSIGNNIKDKLNTGSDLLNYTKTVVKDVFADAFAGENVTTEGLEVSKDDPLIEIKRTIYQTAKLIGIPITGIVGVVKNIGGFFGNVIDGFKTVGSGIGETVKTLFTKSWNGEFIEAFTDNSMDANTGNQLIDNTSMVVNGVTKTVLSIPGLLSYAVGGISRTIPSVIDGFKTIGSSIGTMTSNIMESAVNAEENPINLIFSDKDDTKTGNGLIDGISKVVNSAIKIPLTPVSMLTYGVSSVGKKIIKFVDSLKGAGTLTTADINILNKSKDAKITPFSSEYWKINNNLDGAAGWLYTFNSFMSKILNLPTALLSMINPKNWLPNAVDWLTDKVGVDMTEFEGEGSKSLSGRGTMNESGFVSQLDPRFKNKKFNTGKDSEVQTLGDSGCAPATAANVLNLYAGKGTVMDDASNAALKYKDKNSGVTPDYFQNYLGSNGIGTYSTMNKNEMLSGISQGRPTILLGSDPTNKAKTPYGSASSHYVLATGLDGKGNVIIQDPESKRPNSLYPVRDVIKQTTLGMVTGKGSMDVRSMKSKLKAKLGKVGFGRGSNTVNQDLAKWSPITEGQLNSEIRRLAGPNRGFSGKGKYFIAAANASGLDPRYILAHAALESAWGDSNYAKAGNFFGIGAFDSNPDNAYNYGNSDMESGLINGAVWIRKNFYDAGQTTLYKMRHNNGSHEYATDPDWDNKIASIMDQLPANSSASYHEASENTTSNTNTNSSGLLDALDNLVLSYFNEDGKNLISALFGSNSSSSSDDSTTSSTTSSGYSSGDSKTAKEFYDKYNGVAVDYDGAYGAQCVDLFKQYSDEVLGLKNYVVGGNGGAYNIAYDSRLNPYYDKVSLKDAKYGDWVVWNPTSETNATYGHVAMFTGMDGNYIKAFGTNQGGPGGAANTINVPSGSVAAVLRAKTSGKGSGKVKSSSYQSLPTNILNNYRRKSVSTPIRSVNTLSMSGTGTTTLPSLNYSSTTSGFNVSRAVNGTTTYSVASDSSTARLENLVSVVIDVLRIIADNSSKLSEIVTLLSKALDVNLTNDDIKNLSSNNAQIKNKIANALKSQGSPNGMGNSIMESSTESLANALYSIARA